MSDSEVVLEVKNLCKVFRLDFYRKKVQAVRSVSFEVHRKEIFGLLGPNGAGKTTTIKIVMGLVSPTSGTVKITGKDARDPSARRELGYLPENPYFHEYLTPRELLYFYGRLSGLSRSEIRARGDALIEQVGLKEAARRPLRKFSKGMLQRIGLAQALLANPRFLLLDEPMSGLDPIGRKFVADLIQELNDNGTTVLFSSHILSDVERLCDRVVILNKGIKAAEGRIDDLLKIESGTQTFEELFVRKALEVSGETTRDF